MIQQLQIQGCPCEAYLGCWHCGGWGASFLRPEPRGACGCCSAGGCHATTCEAEFWAARRNRARINNMGLLSRPLNWTGHKTHPGIPGAIHNVWTLLASCSSMYCNYHCLPIPAVSTGIGFNQSDACYCCLTTLTGHFYFPFRMFLICCWSGYSAGIMNHTLWIVWR